MSQKVVYSSGKVIPFGCTQGGTTDETWESVELLSYREPSSPPCPPYQPRRQHFRPLYAPYRPIHTPAGARRAGITPPSRARDTCGVTLWATQTPRDGATTRDGATEVRSEDPFRSRMCLVMGCVFCISFCVLLYLVFIVFIFMDMITDRQTTAP